MNDTPKAIVFDHSNINAALAAAQAEMGPALKQTINPHLKSKYADLASVTEACMPALNRHGIAVYHQFGGEGDTMRVATILAHSSGDTLETAVPVLLAKRDMQGLGSAITYARRYGLMMLAGIAPEDDDGQAAVASGEAPRQPTPAIDLRAEEDRLTSQIAAAPDEAALKSMWEAEDKARRAIHAADAAAYDRIKAAAAARKSEILAASIGDEIPH